MIWSWSAWLHQSVLRDRPVCLLNLDETSVSFAEARRSGNVVMASKGTLKALFYERIARRETHGHLTLVALLCADASMQPHVPQLLLTKDVGLLVAEKAALRRLQPPVFWILGTDGWVTQDNLPHLLTIIRRHICHHLPHHEIVLLLDCAAQHVTARVFAHASRLRMHLLFVPGKTTWLLQPLDTHVFSLFKRTLHQLQTDARAATPDGCLGRSDWVNLLDQAIRQVLVCRTWTHAFEQNGFGGDLTPAARARIYDACNSLVDVTPQAPTDNDLALVFGRRIPNVSRRVLSSALRLQAADALALDAGATLVDEALPPLPPPAGPPEESIGDGPISSRTRLRRASSIVDG